MVFDRYGISVSSTGCVDTVQQRGRRSQVEVDDGKPFADGELCIRLIAEGAERELSKDNELMSLCEGSSTRWRRPGEAYKEVISKGTKAVEDKCA